MRQTNLGGIIAILVALFATSATARWAVKCQAVLRDRIDPVHDPGELASSFNLFAGANAVGETVTYDQLRRSACSSCSTVGDMSLYWTSQLFYFDGMNYMFVPDDYISVHYDQNPTACNKSNTTAVPFPEGFQMSAGHISKRHPANDVPDGAIRFECHDKQAPNGIRSTTATLPQQFCPDGLSAKIGFPSCWDGKKIHSTDGSHVAYPVNGACALSHPRRLVSVSYEVFYNLTLFKGELGFGGRPNLLAFTQKGPIGYDNEPTGYGFQGVFVNGWDTSIFQSAMLNCNEQSNSPNNTCHPLLSQTIRPSKFVSCTGTQRAPEAITAPASPSPNPLSSPSNTSTRITPGFQTTTVATRQTLKVISTTSMHPTSLTSSVLVSSSLVATISTTITLSTLVTSTSSASSTKTTLPTNIHSSTLVTSSTSSASSDAAQPAPTFFGGWSYWKLLGCGVDYVQSRTWTDAWTDNTMSRMTCTNHCFSKGKEWAGLENGDTCYCSSTPPPADRLPRDGADNKCDSIPCVGDVNDPCGGDPTKGEYVLSLYYHCQGDDPDCPLLPSDAKEIPKLDLQQHSKRSEVSMHPELASFEEANNEFPAIIETVTLSNGDFLGIKVCTPSGDPHSAPHCILFESHNAAGLSSEFIQFARRRPGFEWREYATLWDQAKPLVEHPKSHDGPTRLAMWIILCTVPFFVGVFAFLLGLSIGEVYTATANRVLIVD